MKRALLVIDVQNEYFTGKMPVSYPAGSLDNILHAMDSARAHGVPVVVVRCGSELYAVEDRCTHDGEALTGAQVEDCQIICPRHGAHFCLRTGEALTPPAYEPWSCPRPESRTTPPSAKNMPN